jgi:hypothetical protein
VSRNVAIRISIRQPELFDEFNCELQLDRDSVQAIVEKAAGVPQASWSHVRTELSIAIEQTVLNWADAALKPRVDRVRAERELAEMNLENLLRREREHG